MEIELPTLAIMAAGIGSRYGGRPKQLRRLGSEHKTLMDYSIYDAWRLGYNRVVLVIRRELRDDFDRDITLPWEAHMKIEYVYQELDKIPTGTTAMSQNRLKPWGTAHAVWCLKEKMDTPFVVINADDYYGISSLGLITEFLRSTSAQSNHYGLVTFPIRLTLSPHGSVSRAVCEVNSSHQLQRITEYLTLSCRDGRVYSQDQIQPHLNVDTPISMNMWGFTPRIFPWFEREFIEFLQNPNRNWQKDEYILPYVINGGLQKQEFSVSIFYSNARWIGITYPQDDVWVEKCIEQFPQIDFKPFS